ncbi:unnamed protein product [Spirodela intermedia]|nr:unnamed protein product [Spirodela intermedia]
MKAAHSCFRPSAIVTVAMFLVCHAGTSTAAMAGAGGKDNMEFIRAACGTTSYPRLCFETLSTHARTIQRDPVILAIAALSVSLESARGASAAMTKIAAQGLMKPRESAAVKDCVETMGDSVEELRRSIKEMAHLRRPDRDLAFHISNIQTWVSAALTDEKTCMESFADNSLNGRIKDAMRIHVVNVAQRTSNALALISALISSPP